MEENLIPLQRARRSTEDSLSDEGIAAACGAGDRSAVTILFDRFHERVARYIYRINGRDQIDDLVQSTFLEVVKGKTVYDGRVSVTTWLFAIATNIVRHHRRSFSRRLRLHTALGNEPQYNPWNPGERMDDEQKIKKANEALQALGESQRSAFILCVLEGLSAREAAAVLQTSESAVWKRVCKAREALRRKMVEE